LFNQTRPDSPYPAEVSVFADALEDIMADGTHDLAAIADGLNARRIVSGGRKDWSPETLAAYFAELANA
jgi:phage FluMu gp28-like protein